MIDYKTILIVEDDEILANCLSKSFANREYETAIASNSKEALERIKNFHPRYALVDLKMPGESGLECIKKIHEFDSTIKIVMLTGYASIATTVEAMKLGACHYLAKPATVDDIIAAFNNEKKISLQNKKTSLRNIEWEYINWALLEAGFNISKAAKILGLHRRTLARKLEKRYIN
jgi:two-component system response regulator RegA